VVLLIKFFVTISVLESYFLYQYFRSDSFLNKSIDIINEAAVITDQNFNNFLLYQLIIDILGTNGTSTVYDEPTTKFIVEYLNNFNNELENLLNVH